MISILNPGSGSNLSNAGGGSKGEDQSLDREVQALQHPTIVADPV